MKSGRPYYKPAPELVAMRRQLVRDLKHLGAYLHHNAATGSQYVKFADPRLGSLRIADHKGREQYRYKWNIEQGRKESVRTLDRGIVRRFYAWHDATQLVHDLTEEQNKVLAQRGEYCPHLDPWAAQRQQQRSRQ